MYCPSCGLEVTLALNYCKSCGANLNSQPTAGGPPSGPTRVVISLPLVVLFLAIAFVGAIVPIGVLSNLFELKEIGINSNQIGALLVVIAATGLCTAALLVWLLMKLVGVAVFEPKRKRRESIRTSELDAGREVPLRREIAPPPDLIPSVTEHTTRTFDRTRVTD
ncbi:MAG: hypothetical protein ACREDR_07020 [Blastocatellia bacterium]